MFRGYPGWGQRPIWEHELIKVKPGGEIIMYSLFVMNVNERENDANTVRELVVTVFPHASMYSFSRHPL